jgi:hypothetical protein
MAIDCLRLAISRYMQLCLRYCRQDFRKRLALYHWKTTEDNIQPLGEQKYWLQRRSPDRQLCSRQEYFSICSELCHHLWHYIMT